MEIKLSKSNRSKLLIVVIILIAIALFISVYSITYNIINSKNSSNLVNKNIHDIISKNSTRELVIVGEDVDGEFIEKNRIKLELEDINKVFTEMYPIGDYKIMDFDDKSIVIMEINNSNFDPNMYYIGEKDGYITVFKSDNNGNLFIENESSDISSKKVESLPVMDRNLVLNYELKSGDREEVQDILSELET